MKDQNIDADSLLDEVNNTFSSKEEKKDHVPILKYDDWGNEIEKSDE